MKNKAYIVANKEQELEVLKKFEAKGLVWLVGAKPTEAITSEGDIFNDLIGFPYVLIEGLYVSWSSIEQITDENIVYDGRKEEKMYKVTQEFMDELIKWRDENYLDLIIYVTPEELLGLPVVVKCWQTRQTDLSERNNRLIAIIQWLNGEDIFEVEEPHKFVVRSDKEDREEDYAYVLVENGLTTASYFFYSATKFDTREEAQEWANSHQVVVEIDAEGNEVE